MRHSILIAAAAAMLVVASAASAQGRPMQHAAYYTPPLGSNEAPAGTTIEAAFVNTGVPIVLTIELCSLAGVRGTSGFGACDGVSLARGQGCWIGDLGTTVPLYAKFRVSAPRGGSPEGMGSLRVIGPDGATAAVQTHGPVPDRAVTEQ
jgi:hypothetical protein